MLLLLSLVMEFVIYWSRYNDLSFNLRSYYSILAIRRNFVFNYFVFTHILFLDRTIL